MPRRKAPQLREPAVVHINAVYTPLAVSKAFGVPLSCLSREIRLGRLKASWRSQRYFFLGQWLIDWIKDGMLTRSVYDNEPLPVQKAA